MEKEAALRARQQKGGYDSLDDGESFAAVLTDNLQEVSHDKHLRVNFVAMVLPKEQPGTNPEAEARMRTQMERNNCAFEKAERLPPNVGLRSCELRSHCYRNYELSWECGRHHSRSV